MAPYPDYPLPADEEQRLRDLERHGVIGAASDEHFDRIVALAGSIFQMPIVAITLVDAKRQWFLARKGIAVSETPREMAFCAHAIAGDGVMVVNDATSDERFNTNPLVLEDPHVRFYAGAPLESTAGHKLGTLCVIDHEPRQLSQVQLQQLQWLAELVMRELELHRLAMLDLVTGLPNRPTFLRIGEQEVRHARAKDHVLSLLIFDIDNFRQINNRWGHHAGDEVLLDLCRLVRTFLREQDYAGRLGDGEFGLLFVGMDTDAALVIAEELRGAVAVMPGIHSHSDYRLHISGGLTNLGSHDHAFTQLLQRANDALQLAKGNGRNQIACQLEGD